MKIPIVDAASDILAIIGEGQRGYNACQTMPDFKLRHYRKIFQAARAQILKGKPPQVAQDLRFRTRFMPQHIGAYGGLILTSFLKSRFRYPENDILATYDLA